ncbi:MAG: PilN domain-containing protein [Desulfobulbus sp.]|jgi:type IV pilus assembly protein PilN|nr:PilN domain-containing protein [Desulfobulbus sp.]
MIHINLLPVREITQRLKLKRQLFLSALVLLCFLAVLGLIAISQTGKKNNLEQAHQELQQEKQQYTKILNEIKKLEEDKKILETRIAVIQQLKDSASLTVHILDEIATLTPQKRLWLTGVTQSGSSLKVSGMALDNQTVAKYMDDLAGSRYIQNVSLANSSMKQFAERNLKSFSLSATATAPGEEKIQEEPTK